MVKQIAAGKEAINYVFNKDEVSQKIAEAQSELDFDEEHHNIVHSLLNNDIPLAIDLL